VTADAARVFTIPPGAAFVDALAAGLIAETADQPLALSRYLVLLPTRRAARALVEAFLRRTGGQPVLPPLMAPIGDVDPDGIDADSGGALDLPPEMPALRRQLMLARLIRGRADSAMTVEHAARLAEELARLIDRVDTEGLTFDRLGALVPDDYARHWQDTLKFLRIVTDNWPAILAEAGAIDPARRRTLMLLTRAEAWRRAPPDGPVIVAGSTGSIPATAELIATVAGLPRGRIVLPGLDRDATDEAWAALEPSHPQFGLKQLLDRLNVARAAVADWPGCAGLKRTDPARAALVNAALVPAAASEIWRHLPPPPDSALQDVMRLDCASPQEEASAIALLMRGALETQGRTAALVTPDRDLARRVAAELARWDIEIDDSAGQPLADTPPGALLALVLDMAAGELAPVPLLAAIKHPLAAAGRDAAATRALVRRLEIAVLRGPRPAPGFAGLRRALRSVAERHELDAWLATLEAAAAPFVAALRRRRAELAALAEAHAQFAEWLAGTAHEPGPARLWAGTAGEEAARFMAELADAAASFPSLPGAEYPAFFKAVLAQRRVRRPYGGHPRLAIWGPLEARLQHADLTILGGLNEGTWPPEVETDPWMSRPMRQRFGLPQPERRIGLAAHDFAQAMGAPRVVLTRATRVEGAPTVPSRWLLRLDALLGRFPGKRALLAKDAPVLLAALDALDRPAPPWPHVPAPAPPAPRPPLAARPRQLSVTRIETWMRDPYAIYARHILKLVPLDPLDADAGAAERGQIVHHALDAFMKECPGTLPPDALDRLIRIGRRAFRPLIDQPGVAAFWWPRFLNVAAWFVENERLRRAGLAESVTETKGRLTFEGPAGPFVLTAKADRIDRDRLGRLLIVDYKTGRPPRAADVAAGFAPQLPLEALIAVAGNFAGVGAGPVADLAYWRLSGGEPAGEITPLAKTEAALADLIAQARDGLLRLIAAFDDPATPYLAEPDPERASAYPDYAHLARVKEWAGEDGGGVGGEP
jgi:ATP-dependent helicase/nuclease subunit B